MSFQATFSSSTSASPRTAGKRHIEGIRTDLYLSQKVWMKPMHAWRSEQDYCFSTKPKLPATSQDYSPEVVYRWAWSLVTAFLAHSFLPWVCPWENHKVWLDLLEEKGTPLIFQWKKHFEREGGRREKSLFFPQPLLPGRVRVWSIEGDPVLILRHQAMESLRQLLIRLDLSSHFMHVYSYFSYLSSFLGFQRENGLFAAADTESSSGRSPMSLTCNGPSEGKSHLHLHFTAWETAVRRHVLSHHGSIPIPASALLNV